MKICRQCAKNPLKTILVFVLVLMLNNIVSAQTTWWSHGPVNFTSVNNWTDAQGGGGNPPGSTAIFTSGTDDFNVQSADNLTINAAVTVNNITINTSGTITQSGFNLQLNGTLTVTQSTLSMGSNYVIALSVTVNGGTFNAGSSNQHQFNITLSSGTFNSNTSTIELFAIGNATVFNKTSGTFSGGTATFKIKPTTQTGFSSSTLTLTSNDNITFEKVIFEGTKVSGFGTVHALNFNGLTFNINNSFERTGVSSAIGGTGTLSFNSNAELKYNANIIAFTVGNEWPIAVANRPANVSNNSSFNVTLAGSRTVTGTLTLSQTSGNLDVSGSTNTLTIEGTLKRNTSGTTGIITSSSGDIDYSGTTNGLEYLTSASTTIGAEWPATQSPRNVTITNVSGGISSSGNIDRTILEDLALNTGSLSLGTGTLTVSGTVSGSVISGSATINNSTQLVIGNGSTGISNAQEISGSLTLNKLEVDKRAGTTAGNTATMTGGASLTFTSGGILTITNGILDLNGTGRLGNKPNISLTVSSGGTLRTGGEDDLQDLASPTLSGTVVFSGSSAETIPGFSFTNITMDNSSANRSSIDASSSATVSGTLTLTDGIITTSSTSTLTVSSGGSISGGNSGSYIDGPLSIQGTASTKTFPIGDGASSYRPVQITGSDGNTTFEMFDINPNGTTDGSLSRISSVRYWEASGSITTGTIELSYGSGDGVNPSQLASLVVASSTSSNGQYTDRGTSGNGVTFPTSVVSETQTMTLNDFTLGSTSTDHSLPVALASFEANIQLSNIVLTWITESELQNEGFNIYRRDKEMETDWDLLTFSMIPGQGNTADKTEYKYTDRTAQAGVTYEYMLESISYAGVRVQEKVVEVLVPMPTEYATLGNYPNPFNPTTNIGFRLPERSEISIVIYGIQGNLVRELALNQSFDAGDHFVSWDATDNNGQPVASGMYLYLFTAGKYNKTEKMLLLK